MLLRRASRARRVTNSSLSVRLRSWASANDREACSSTISPPAATGRPLTATTARSRSMRRNTIRPERERAQARRRTGTASWPTARRRARVEQVAHGVDERRHRVGPLQQVADQLVVRHAGDVLHRQEDRGDEEPGQERRAPAPARRRGSARAARPRTSDRPSTSANSSATTSGQQQQLPASSVPRTTSATGSTSASITRKVPSCTVATDAGIVSRGKRTLRTSGGVDHEAAARPRSAPARRTPTRSGRRSGTAGSRSMSRHLRAAPRRRARRRP